MDAIRLKKAFVLLTWASAVFGTGCAQQKTSSSVFPDNNAGAASACTQQASQSRFIVQWEDGTFTVEQDESADHFRKHFVENNLNLIKHVDHDYKIKLHIENVNSQPLQTAADVAAAAATPDGLNWGPGMIRASSLWTQNISGDGVIVGVVDGMVDVTHAQLKSNIYINTGEIPNNGIDDDHNGFIDDYMGIQVNTEVNDPTQNQHGSHVSGIIAADPTAGPVVGVAPKAKILPAQFIANDGGGSIGDAIIGMNYVVSRGAKIINLSWGAGPCVEIPTLQAAMQQISDKGVLLVTAAGNGDQYGIGINVDVTPTYPSAYNFTNQINVAASTFDDYMISFSNYGTKTVHVAAPGVNIYSTVPGNKVEAMSGTSMAAPMVSGAAALLWGAIPTATASQIKQALMRSVDIVSGRALDVASRGRINVDKAYTSLKQMTGQ